MEEETEGLDFLIQQRNNRKRLMRMISWGGPVDVTAKQSDIVDERPCLDDDEVSTGDEEFFSAEEGSDISEDEVEEIESDSEEEPINLSERKKPSKRKRKRLKQLLKSLEDPIEIEQFSLLNYFAPDYKSKKLTGNILDVGATPCVKRLVPSLVELSLDSCRSLEHWQNLPPGVHRLMSMFRYEEFLRLLQIEWCHRLLRGLEKNFVLPSIKSNEKDGICSQVCCVRDLKQAGTTGNWHYYSHSENVPSKINVFPVVWPLCLKESSSHYGQAYNQRPYEDAVFFASIGLEVMANIIDLMLPVTVGTKQKWKKNKHDQSNVSERSLASALSKIQHALEKRHPKYTNYMYGLAEGYALWVRGDVENAEKSFNRHLSRKAVDSFHKALIRNEIGRMFMMFGDLVKASQYFLEAAVDEEDGEEKNATTQALALIAMQTDTGLLTASKAQESAAAWFTLIRRQESYIPNLASFAVESAMRVYGGHVIDHKLTSKWHIDVLERLTQMTHMAANARLAKALVYAMLGEDGASKETYTNYLSLGSSFYEPEKSHYESSYPFGIILDQMNERARPIQPIKLLWRTQMCYPSFCYDKCESDYHSKPTDDCSLPLNLHLSDAGYLTGDMSMQTPPIRGIYLDPYTGGLCLPHVPLKATPWKDLSVHQPDHVELNSHRETFRLPRILRVMDNDKCVVDFCIASDANGCNQSTTLTWIGSNGTRMTLDLKKMIRVEAKKELEMKLNTLREKEGDDWVNDRVALLDLFMERGWMLSFSAISVYAKDLERRKEWEKEEEKGKRCHLKDKKKSAKLRNSKPTLIRVNNFKLVLDSFYTFSETVLFQFKLDNNLISQKCSPLLVVVNCDNIHTFKTPKIYSNVHHLAMKTDWSPQLSVTTTPLQSCQGYTQKHRFPHAEIFIVKGESKKGTMSIFDVDGNMTEQLVHKEQDSPQYYVIGKHFYYLKQKDEITGLQKRSVGVEENEEDYRPLADLQPPNQVEDIFVIKMALGICVMNPLSMDLFTFNKCTDSLTYPLESDSTIIMGEFDCITTFSSRRKKSGTKHQGEVVQVAVGVCGCVFILEVPFDGKSCQYGSQVDVVLQVNVPGIPAEICLISYDAGFIVAASLNEALEEDGYRNHVYQFKFDGRLMGILPFLGKGPHRFTPIYLEQSEEHEDLGDDVGKSGWHIFFVDGHGALACFNASVTEDQ